MLPYSYHIQCNDNSGIRHSFWDKFIKFINKFNPLNSKVSQLEEELRLLTSYSSDTIYRLRYKDMKYDYISPAIEKLLGYSAEEMKEVNFRSLIVETKIISDGIHTVKNFDELEKVRKNGDVRKWQADYLLKTKNGQQIWATDISSPWLDKKGDIIGSVGSLRNITNRINAENKAREEMLRFVHTDAMTGLSNRKVFLEAIENELKRIKHSNNHFSILLIDVDNFKLLNERHGHKTGDKILIELANFLQSSVKEGDIVARIGGEEFGIFMPDTKEEGAFWAAERICLKIAKNKFSAYDLPDKTFKVTVSIGVSSTEGNRNINLNSLYKKADTRLFIAKQMGRNQVSNDEIVQTA